MGKQNYAAKAVGHDWGSSAIKKTRYIEVTFEVLASDPTAPELRVPWQGYFTEGTQDRTIESLRLCGCTFPNDDITNLVGIGKNTVQIVVEETEYGPRVAWVNALGSIREENRMGAPELASFAKSMRGALLMGKKAAGGGGAARTPAPSGPAPYEAHAAPVHEDVTGEYRSTAAGSAAPASQTTYGSVSDDDIPF